MKFETILNLVSPEFAQHSPLADKTMFVFDHKDRKLTSLKFYDGYSITDQSKEALIKFCERTDRNTEFFIVYLFTDSICIYDELKGFKLRLYRVS